MNNLIQDVRYAIRMFIKNTGFTVVAVLALAIGIGANTAIFSVVNAILLRPLPYQYPDRLVMLWQDQRARGGPEREWASPADFADWRDQNQSFDHVIALLGWGPTLTGRGEPEDLAGAAVSHDTFEMLGISPALGRSFLPEEDKQGAGKVVVLSDALWRNKFSADPNIVGTDITLGGESYSVIGVMPPSFKPPIVTNATLWRPLMAGLSPGCQRGCVVLRVLARMKPDVGIESARADMSAVAASLEAAYPRENVGTGSTVDLLQDQVVGQIRPMLLLLLAAVALVLLIACVNVANLMLARASAREKEIAIRTALGARRGRIIRQLLTESVLISLIGGTAGLLLAFWMVDVLKSFSPAGTPRVDEVAIDRSVLLFTLGVAVLTGILSGLAPAFQSVRGGLSSSLKEGKGAGTAASGRKVRSVLVVTEIAFAVMLLIGAGLMVRSFIKLMSVDAGFNSRGVVALDVILPRARYREPQRSAAFYAQVMERARELPGVESVGAGSGLPLAGNNTDSNFYVEGRPEPEAGAEPAAWYSSVTPDYFQTMGIRLIKGRWFGTNDTADSTKVVVISQKFVERYFPDEDPIGRRIGDQPSGPKANWREIVGVVGDVKQFGLDVDSRVTMYLPHSQQPARFMTVVVRGTGDLTTIAASVRSQIGAIDKDLGVSNIRTMEQVRDSSVAPQRFTLLLLMIFAGAAVLLAAVGIYGVISYTVAQRTPEIGLRMALGASRQDVVALVAKQGMLLTGLGVCSGLLAAFGLTRLIQTLLFGVTSTDPLTFGLIPVLLAIVALAACVIPARRAARVDPMVALRYE